jgi:hypothetical protein
MRDTREQLAFKIYQILRSNKKKRWLIKEIAEELGRSDQTVRNVMPVVVDLNYAHKFPAAGNGHVYKYNTKKRDGVRIVADYSDLIGTLSPTDILNLLNKFAKSRWHPKIIDSSRNLPAGVARLYELASEVAHGAVVSSSDLDEVRGLLNDFVSDLEAALRVVYSLLGTKELWDTDSFASFLIDVYSVDDLKSQAFKAKNLN